MWTQEEGERQSTHLTLPVLSPPSRCHATDTTEDCGGGVLVVLHVISGIPPAVMIAWSVVGTGGRRAISGPDALDLPRRTNMLAATGPGEKCGERRVKGLDVTHSRHIRQVIALSDG